jgi:hypothetical protein
MAYYKVLLGNRSCHGEEPAWSLPTANGPGSWQTCEQGFSLTREPVKWYVPGCTVYLVECRDTDFRECRLVRSLNDAQLADLRIYVNGKHKLDSGGGVVVDSAVVTANGTATVTAYEFAKVTAEGFAEVTAYGSAMVTAYDHARVTAYDHARVTAYDHARVKAYDYVRVEACDYAKVKATGSVVVRASDFAKVTATGNA